MPKHLFFDLDHTLWDFETNARETLIELYDFYRLSEYSDHGVEHFLATYNKHNDRMWDLYRQHKIEKPQLRTQRFTDTFREMGMREEDIPHSIWERYLDICPTKTSLMPGAIETLDYLTDKYALHLITNGFAETQRRKLHHSGLDKYFDTLTISEEIGVQKPHPTIFQEALKLAGSAERTSTYVGDNEIADVQGGLNSGWKVFWLNPEEKISDERILAHADLSVIHRLTELKSRL